MGIVVIMAVILFVPVCVLLTLIILLQDSKGEGLSSSAFGGSGIQSVLGGHGAATFLSKLTTWVAIGFMVISLFLMRFYGETGTGGLTPIKKEAENAQEPAETENAGEVVEDTTEDNPKGTITTTEENGEETPAEETPDEDSKGTIEPTEETE